LIISAYFASTYSFTLKKRVFFDLFSLPQNLKMTYCKGYRISGRLKKAKKDVVNADFSKNEVRLKALSMRFKKKGGTVFFFPPTFSAGQKVKPVPIF